MSFSTVCLAFIIMIFTSDDADDPNYVIYLTLVVEVIVVIAVQTR